MPASDSALFKLAESSTGTESSAVPWWSWTLRLPAQNIVLMICFFFKIED